MTERPMHDIYGFAIKECCDNCASLDRTSAGLRFPEGIVDGHCTRKGTEGALRQSVRDAKSTWCQRWHARQ